MQRESEQLSRVAQVEENCGTWTPDVEVREAKGMIARKKGTTKRKGHEGYKSSRSLKFGSRKR